MSTKGLKVDNIRESTADNGVNVYATVFDSDNSITLGGLSLGASAFLFATSDELLGAGSIHATGNLTLSAGGELNTAQDILITSTPIFNSITINNTPSSDTDATTKSYVDGLVEGLKWKESVLVATTVNITLEDEQTIDTVGVVAGDRVLVWKQDPDEEENGIYIVVAGANPWTRAEDANSEADIINAVCTVEQGGTYADKSFICTNDAITLETTDIVFVLKGSTTAHNDLSGLDSGDYLHLTSAYHGEITPWLDEAILGVSNAGDLNLGASGDFIAATIIDNSLTVASLIYSDNSTKQHKSVTLSSNLNLTTGTLDLADTIQIVTLLDVPLISNSGGNVLINDTLEVDIIAEYQSSGNGVTIDESLIIDKKILPDSTATTTYVTVTGTVVEIWSNGSKVAEFTDDVTS